MQALPAAVAALNELQAALEQGRRECRDSSLLGVFQTEHERMVCTGFFDDALHTVKVLRRSRLPRAVVDPAEYGEIERVIRETAKNAESVLRDGQSANVVRAAFASAEETLGEVVVLTRRAGAALEEAAGGFGVGTALFVGLLLWLKFGGRR